MSQDDNVITASTKSVSLTIVDLFGSLVPGIIWLNILTNVCIFAYNPLNPDIVNNSKRIVGFLNGLTNELPPLTFTIYIAACLIIGFLIKTVSMEILDALIPSILAGYVVIKPCKFKKSLQYLDKPCKPVKWFWQIRADCRFPYA